MKSVQKSQKSVVEWSGNETHQELIEELKRLGIGMQMKDVAIGTSLKGLNIVVTGTLPTLSRSKAHELIEVNGGTVGSSVTKKTSFLVVGDDAGSKLEKAKSLNIPVLDEAAFLKKING